MVKLLVVLAVIIGCALAFPHLQTNINDESRIVGGSFAKEGQFPYQISIRTPGNNHYCGGSIISDRWIVTAAHCFNDVPEEKIMKYYIVAGSIYLNTGGQQHKIAQFIQHEQYDRDTYFNDIALIQTTSPISLGENVASIPLGSWYVPEGTSVVLSGWGRTSYPGEFSNQLKYLNMEVVGNPECNKINEGSWLVTDKQICAFVENGQGGCRGDSGGPLVNNGELVGTFSWIKKYCARGYPDVYTRTASYIEWIQSNAVNT